MSDGSLRLYDHGQQVQLVDESLHDARPSLPTGFEGIDSLLRRGGILPGNFVLLGGRTGTRKSTITVNIAMNMAKRGIPVGIVGLDEAPWQYVVQLLSVYTGRPEEWLEERWDDDEGKELQREWKAFAHGLVHIFAGNRPGIEHLEAGMEMADMGSSKRPAVLFVDYFDKLTRDKKYGYSSLDRLERLADDLAIWSTETGVAVVVLHQLGRNDEHGGSNSRNQGHIPVTLTQLKYGGEAAADIVLGTYRPSMNPLANMSFDVAHQVLGERFDEDLYWETVAVAKKYRRSTFLQLLKNRPGTRREERGVELLSPYGESLLMEEKLDEPEEVEDQHDGQPEAARSG